MRVGRKPTREGRPFATTTQGLVALLAWLTESRVTHVAMEATGVYWKPVWTILSDGRLVLMVANAAHIKNVPGRKSAMNDAMWIADRLACGLIRASFVPEDDIQERRALMRPRKQLVREQTRHVQRLETTLEEANIKHGAVISDLMGVRGRRMIAAMIPTGPARGLKAHGQRKSTRLRRGAPWLKTRLVQCAWAAKRAKDSSDRAPFFRLQSRRGPQTAICAGAASILTAIYHMLKSGLPHRDLGANSCDRRSPEAKARRLVSQLAKLGFAAQLQPPADAT